MSAFAKIATTAFNVINKTYGQAITYQFKDSAVKELNYGSYVPHTQEVDKASGRKITEPAKFIVDQADILKPRYGAIIKIVATGQEFTIQSYEPKENGSWELRCVSQQMQETSSNARPGGE